MEQMSIEDHGVIGNLSTCALVGINGAIDSFCFPHFDSPSLFAQLLEPDPQVSGIFQLAPDLEHCRGRQFYFPDTNILLTRFKDQGISELCDFMPIVEGRAYHGLVRIVSNIRGKGSYKLSLRPRYNYGRSKHKIEKNGECLTIIPEDKSETTLKFYSNVELSIEDNDIFAHFEINHDEKKYFVLQSADCPPIKSLEDIDRLYQETLCYWRQWIAQCHYDGNWQSMVRRSLLTLKLLHDQKYGSLVAAPTFGLPEVAGGEKNWDYRYTWIRDTSFALQTFIELGVKSEAKAFMKWLEDRCLHVNEKEGPLRVLYRVNGEKDVPEFELPHFRGHKGARPILVGNEAANQLQLDIYGELMEAIYLYDLHVEQIHHQFWEQLVKMVDWVSQNWDRKDESIWELRGGVHHHLYSRVMTWKCLDLAIKLGQHRSFPFPAKKWVEHRDRIYQEIMDHFWDKEKKVFVRHSKTTEVDGAILVMPLTKLISPTDPMWLSTMQAFEEQLVEDTLVYRFPWSKKQSHDSDPKREGSFNLCTFWYVDCLLAAGDVEKARNIFERMLGYSNQLGLFAEEMGHFGEHMGNFPHVFAHVGLINSAMKLDKKMEELKREPFPEKAYCKTG